MPSVPFLPVARIEVQWGDVDRMQHVNNVVYFRWFETARTNYFEKLGDFAQGAGKKIYPILASIRCDYRAQVTYRDTVRVSYATLRIGRSSVTHGYRVESEAQNKVVAEGEGTWLSFDYQAQRPVAVSDALIAAMAALEGRPLTVERP